MNLVLAITAGFIAWLVLWALGASGFDAFMVTILFALLGVTGHVLVRHLPRDQ
ncbi:MAG TPA: hypothetical protein VGW11_01670 [Solirubrobacteraceae bacterium]|nr:hypothetical protein [Solirubrobacteraceae bacterium]